MLTPNRNNKNSDERRRILNCRPIQFLKSSEKNEEWYKLNMDYAEYFGMRQIADKARTIRKNRKLSQGEIDLEDYVPSSDNENCDIINQVEKAEVYLYDLKNYPLIPSVINVLMTEFNKRAKKVTYRAIDEYTVNKILEEKRKEIENSLVSDAEKKVMNKMASMGVDTTTPEFQQKMKQFEETEVKTLPEIEDFFSKDYMTIAEEWASKQHKIDSNRFKLDELEDRAFRDSLENNCEYWHFIMKENDYDIEVLRPESTFVDYSVNKRYVSDARMAGFIKLMTIPEVIESFGWKMTASQVESMNEMYRNYSEMYSVDGFPNQGAYYNNDGDMVNDNSLEYKKLMSFNNNFKKEELIDNVLSSKKKITADNREGLVRVTTCYWKTQTKIGFLTSINGITGEVTNTIVSDDYHVYEKPVYNLKIVNKKSVSTLISGEHIDWVYINETVGGIKIGENNLNISNKSMKNPVYIGIDGNEMGPLRFQLKGSDNMWSSKIPIEGIEYDGTSVVKQMKSGQVGFNLVNNQILDILIDEIGTVTSIPGELIQDHSVNEEWGDEPYIRTRQAMKESQILQIKGDPRNPSYTQQLMNNLRTLDLSQNNKLSSRLSLSEYFKNLTLAVVGFTPQRMGQQIGQYSSGKKIEQEVVGSYAQTEYLYTRHCDRLMPRVHEMRTNISQYYMVMNPSKRMQVSLSEDERKFFEINSDEILLSDINCYATTNANMRDVMNKMKEIAEQRVFSGNESLDKLGMIMESESIAEMNKIFKKMEEESNRIRKEKYENEKEISREKIEAERKERQEDRTHDENMLKMKIKRDLLTTEIKSSGFAATQDINDNNVSDFDEHMKDITQREQYEDLMDYKRKKDEYKKSIDERKLDLKEKELQMKSDLKLRDLTIAKENRNSYDKK